MSGAHAAADSPTPPNGDDRMKELSSIHALLQASSTLSLATVDAGGLPHAANVNFMSDGRGGRPVVYWLSSPEAAHSRHLAAVPHVAATAYVPFTTPDEIRGVQIRGRASIVPHESFDTIWPQFCQKFPYAAEMEARARADRFYQLQPEWIRLIDNTVRFGFKQEWQIEPDRDGHGVNAGEAAG